MSERVNTVISSEPLIKTNLSTRAGKHYRTQCYLEFPMKFCHTTHVDQGVSSPEHVNQPQSEDENVENS